MNLSDYYNAVIELSHGIVVTVDDQGRVVHGNSRFEVVSGYRIRELIGHDWFDTFFEESECAEARAFFRTLVQSGKGTFRKSALTTKTGRVVYIDWNLKPLFDASHATVSVLCVGVDVTEHVERQRDLMREHARLVALNKELSCLHAMNRIMADTESSLDELLRQIVARIPPAFQHPEATGVCLRIDGREITGGAFRPDAACRMEHDVLTQRVRRGRLRVTLHGTDASGALRSFLPTEHGLLEALARHVGWIVAKREALATKRNLEQQLQHADRLAKIGQFAAGVAHELNEPLANILGFAQLAVQTPALPEQTRRDLDNIVKSALHSREVIKKLMIFCRQVPMRKVLTDLNQVVREGLYLTEMSAAKNNVRVEMDLAAELPPLFGDPQHLKQVVVNLAVNAIHAMPGGGRLFAGTSSYKDDVYLTIRDSGLGMDAEVLRQIFSPFFTTKDVDQGTGLGLAVVHGIISAHGGVIDVRSEEGRGTLFEIAFPCSKTAPDVF